MFKTSTVFILAGHDLNRESVITLISSYVNNRIFVVFVTFVIIRIKN